MDPRARSRLAAGPPRRTDAGRGSSALDGWVRRRAAGEPIAYIRGFKEWYGLRLATDRRALSRDRRPSSWWMPPWPISPGGWCATTGRSWRTWAPAAARWRWRSRAGSGRHWPSVGCDRRERRLGRRARAGQREPGCARRGGAGDRDAGRSPGARRVRAAPGRGGCQPSLRAQRGGCHPVRKPGLGAGDGARRRPRTASTSSARCWRGSPSGSRRTAARCWRSAWTRRSRRALVGVSRAGGRGHHA